MRVGRCIIFNERVESSRQDVEAKDMSKLSKRRTKRGKGIHHVWMVADNQAGMVRF